MFFRHSVYNSEFNNKSDVERIHWQQLGYRLHNMSVGWACVDQTDDWMLYQLRTTVTATTDTSYHAGYREAWWMMGRKRCRACPAHCKRRSLEMTLNRPRHWLESRWRTCYSPSTRVRRWSVMTTIQVGIKGAITSKIKHAITLKTSPARLAQLLQPSLAFCFSLQPMTAYRPGLDGTPNIKYKKGGGGKNLKKYIKNTTANPTDLIWPSYICRNVNNKYERFLRWSFFSSLLRFNLWVYLRTCRTCFMFYCMFYFTCDRSLRHETLHRHRCASVQMWLVISTFKRPHNDSIYSIQSLNRLNGQLPDRIRSHTKRIPWLWQRDSRVVSVSQLNAKWLRLDVYRWGTVKFSDGICNYLPRTSWSFV